MADNLLEMLKNQLSGAVMNQLVGQLGLGADKGAEVLEKSAATMLSGLALKAQQPGGAGDLIDMLNKNNIDGSLLDNLGDVLGSPAKTDEMVKKGGGLVESIFGSKLAPILSLLGGLFGLGSGVMGKVMGMIAPLVLSQLAKVVMGKGMGASGLTDLLKGQLPFLKQSAPAGLGSVLGLADLGQEAVAKVAQATGAAVRTGQEVAGAASRAGHTVAKEAEGGFGKILPWIIAAALGLAALFALRSCGTPKVEDETVGVVTEGGETAVVEAPAVIAEPVTTVETTVPAILPALKSMMLPGDVEVQLPEGGTLEQFVTMLQSPNPDMTKTFAIDAVGFDAGSTTPTVKDLNFFPLLVKILQAFGGASLKFTGHTDDSGTADEQTAASTSMAEALKKMLTELGIPAERIEVEGAGSTKPVVPNDTDENKAKNRRVEFGVTKI